MTPGRGDYCGLLDLSYAQAINFDVYMKVAGFVIAPLVGAMLGLLALANELDHRTVRLAWTQSISRQRWFTAKVAMGAATVAIILVPTAIVFSWWNGAIGDRDLFARQNFGIAGWDLVAYGLFMFALTVVLGVLIRRAGWTLAGALLLFLVVALIIPTKVREHLVTPTVQWSSIDATANTDAFPESAWLLVNGTVPRSTVGTPTWSEVLSTEVAFQRCTSAYPTKTQAEWTKAQSACDHTLHVDNVSVYIERNQFWTLQLREGLIYLAFGIILLGGAWAYVRRIEP